MWLKCFQAGRSSLLCACRLHEVNLQPSLNSPLSLSPASSCGCLAKRTQCEKCQRFPQWAAAQGEAQFHIYTKPQGASTLLLLPGSTVWRFFFCLFPEHQYQQWPAAESSHLSRYQPCCTSLSSWFGWFLTDAVFKWRSQWKSKYLKLLVVFAVTCERKTLQSC